MMMMISVMHAPSQPCRSSDARAAAPTPHPYPQGIIFVGGFSYADTLDSAKGWAGTIRFNDRLLSQFQAFYGRKDTWSLGICNGCQLMALLGWVPSPGGAQVRAARPVV